MLEEDDKVFLISDDYSSAEGYVLQMIEPAKGNKVTKIGNATYMAANNDILYLVNSMTDWSTKPVTTVNTFFTYNIKTGQMNNASFLKDAPAELVSSTLHMLTINDNNGDILYQYFRFHYERYHLPFQERRYVHRKSSMQEVSILIPLFSLINVDEKEQLSYLHTRSLASFLLRGKGQDCLCFARR